MVTGFVGSLAMIGFTDFSGSAFLFVDPPPPRQAEATSPRTAMPAGTRPKRDDVRFIPAPLLSAQQTGTDVKVRPDAVVAPDSRPNRSWREHPSLGPEMSRRRALTAPFRAAHPWSLDADPSRHRPRLGHRRPLRPRHAARMAGRRARRSDDQPRSR